MRMIFSKIFNFLFPSLYNQVLSITIVILVLAVSTLSYILINEGVKSAEKDLLARGISLSKGFSIASELAVYSKDKELMNNILHNIIKEDNILGTAFYDMDGSAISVQGIDPSQKLGLEGIKKIVLFRDIFWKKVLIPDSSVPLYYDLYTPVTSHANTQEGGIFEADIEEKEAIGILRLKIDAVPLQKIRKELLLWSLGISIPFLIIGFGVSVLIVKRITRPIRQLTDMVKEVHEGSLDLFSCYCPPESKDEIGVLSQEFCNMIKTLDDRNRQISIMAKAMESASDMIFLTDSKGLFMYANSSFTKCMGYTQEELIGKIPSILDSKQHPHEYYRGLWQTLKDGKDWYGEMSVKTKSGDIQICETSITPVFDDKGGIINYLAIQRDITDKKRLEEKLLQVQKLETIGTLAGGISHDFNNILGGITGAVSLLKQRMPEGDKLLKYVDMIEQQSYRGAKIVHQLVGFARKGKYMVECVDINKVLEDIILVVTETFDRRIELRYNLAPDIPYVEGDSSQLYQVFLNLAVNARDAMPEGGTLFVRSSQIIKNGGDVNVSANMPPGEYVYICITDTGVGMDKDTQSRIFEPFFTTKEVGKGTGLGLAMVYGIIKSHKGYITVYSEPGMGTSFKIYLPKIVQMEEERDAAIKEATKTMEKVMTVLFVDDEPVLRELARDILESAGYKVYLAKNGEEAVELYRKKGGEIDVAVIDMVMPVMDGGKACEIINKMNPDAKLLVSSGYTEDMIIRNLLTDKVVRGFIQKPYTGRDLIAG
ncbi:MAG: PAS domain S-box protein, partial [Deltaproteobacteria bacterium]|nr:PAS domain S-box protein [Deltaproteobacteria bacterium]